MFTTILLPANQPFILSRLTTEKNASSGLRMNNRSPWGSSGSQIGGLDETVVNSATNGTDNNPSGQNHRYIRHAVSDDLFSELGMLVCRMEGCVFSLVPCVCIYTPNSRQGCSSAIWWRFCIKNSCSMNSIHDLCTFF